MESGEVSIYIQTKGGYREVYPQRVDEVVELGKKSLEDGWNCAVFNIRDVTLTHGNDEIKVAIPNNGDESAVFDYEEFAKLVAPLISPSTLLIFNS